MEVLKTLPGKADFGNFLNVPKQLYPLDFMSQAEFAHINTEFMEWCYYLIIEGELKGSAVLYNNPGHFYNNEKACCVGYFHCINNTEACKLLIDEVKNDVKKMGISYLLGPMNGTTWESYRFRTTNNNPAFFLESSHPVYYNDLFLASGFKEIQTYHTYRFNKLVPSGKHFSKREKQLKESGIRFRHINPDNYEEDMRKIFNLSTESFKNNLFFTPYPWKAFIEKYKLIKDYADPKMTLLAEDKEQNLVGFISTFNDIFCKTHKQFVSKTYARKPGSEYKGVGAVLLGKITDILIHKGYVTGLHAFIISGGKSASVSSKNSEIYRTYKLYLVKVK